MNSFHERSDRRGATAVLTEYVLLGALIALALTWSSWWFYPVAVVLIGTRQYALAESLTHEAVHGNLCASRWLNDALARFTTWPFFYTLTGYRRYHLDHHRVALDDPENNIHEQYEDWGLPAADAPLGRARAAWLFAVRPLLGVMAFHHLRTLCSNVYWDRDLAETWMVAALWAVGLAVAWRAGVLDAVVLYWIVPVLFVVGTLDFWSETGDHYRVRGALTRSDLNPVLNALVARNIGYHALHHRYPGIPWFNLPAAHARLADTIEEQTSRGYGDTFVQMTDPPEASAGAARA